MYLYRTTSGAWVLGNNPNSLYSNVRGYRKLIIHSEGSISLSNNEKPEVTLDYLTTMKNELGDFYESQEELINKLNELFSLM